MYRQIRSLLFLAVFSFGATLSSSAQERAKEMVPRPFVRELAPACPNPAEGCISQIVFVQLFKPGWTEHKDVGTTVRRSVVNGSVTPLRAQGSSQAKGWRGIMPLKSTRKDVEEVIGQPTTAGGSSYQTASESVFVDYSDGPCEKGWPYGWNVARDTVVTISVSPKIKEALATLDLDESKYEKWRAGHISDIVHYTNRNAGIDLEVDEFWGNVISVSYIPTAAEGSLQCPDAAKRLPPGRRQADSFFKFDEYGDIPFSYERERLDLFAAEIRRQPDSEGYIIAYGGMIAYAGEAKTRADCAKNYLIEKHHFKAARILSIDGGYRETRLVELYVEPRGGDLPLARPSVRPSKIKIIEAKKRPASRCPNFVSTQARAVQALPNKQSHKSQERLKDVEVYFTFDPTDPTRERREKSVSLSVRKGGAAEAVVFDRDQSAVVATYKGMLSKAELRRWTGRIRSAIREANSLKEDNTIRPRK